MKIEVMKVKDLVLNSDNPRSIAPDKLEKLKKSIKEFPEMLKLRPVVIDENNVVLGGNMRLTAHIESGLDDIPVIRAEGLTEEQKKEFIIKDNVSGGDWDWDLLGSGWESDQLDEWGLDIPKWDIDDEDLDDDFSLKDGEKDPFQQITFTLADQQASEIKKKINEIKAHDDFDLVEKFGNENSNGNALFAVFMGTFNE